MTGKLSDRIDVTHLLVGLGVWLAAFVIYVLTKAPTLSFWDCGEFIAVSHILGIPHPPGSPLYVIIGRVFSVLPLSSDIAVRVNCLSVFSSSGAALFGYLAGVRILRAWFEKDQSGLSKAFIHAGAASGALFMAYSLTNWNNSVEAEVYGLTMLVMTATLWLLTICAEKSGTPTADRITVLVVYLGFLGIGVHMTAFMMVPIAAVFFVIKRGAGSRTWFATATYIGFLLYLVFALSSLPGEIPLYVPLAIVLLFYLFYIFSHERVPTVHALVAAGMALGALPLLAAVINAAGAGESRQVLSDGLVRAVNVVGGLALAGLAVFAIFCAYRYFSSSASREKRRRYLAPAGFILTALIMIIVLYLPKGYDAFLVVSCLVSAAFLFMFRRAVNWMVLIAIAGPSLVILGVKPFFYGLIVSTVIILLAGLTLRAPGWKTALVIVFCAAAGYSVHTSVPIRSARQPAINENNPSASLAATINFLERKQYGSQSMIPRMFKRRAEWENQFGNYERMGFWRFFHQQYGLTGPRFVLPFMLGLFGIWEVVRRRHALGLLYTILMLVCSVGLVLYMNFADGTRQHPMTGADYIEVRDRDYFFTPAFIFFGLAIGIGAAIAAQYVREAVARFSAVPNRVIIAATFVLFLLPTFAVGRNYHLCDRSGNYIPYDYAWNILASADSNAVLFTYADNDTFPLWCLQEVYGVRPDVTSVNLSLANGTWYIKQIQNTMNVELGWTDNQIDALIPYRTQDGTIFRLQDQVIDAIMNNNYGKRPINFAVTVGGGVKRYLGRPLDPRLVLCGMVWRVAEPASAFRVDLEGSYELYTEKFRSRGVNDPNVYKNETTLRLTRNWANGFVAVADALRRSGDTDRAEALVKQAVDRIPYAPAAIDYLATLYSDLGKTDELRALIESTSHGDRQKLKSLLGRAELKNENYQQAERLLREVLVEDPRNRSAFEQLIKLYLKTERLASVQAVMQQWLQANPQDAGVRQMLDQFDQETGAIDSSAKGES